MPKLYSGNTEHFDFKENSKESFCMNLSKRSTSNSIRIGKFIVLKKTKEMLIQELLLINIIAKGSKEDTLHTTKNNNAPIECAKNEGKLGW